MKLPTTEVGIAKRTFKVEDQDPKNAQQTRAVSRAERTSVKFSSWTACSNIAGGVEIDGQCHSLRQTFLDLQYLGAHGFGDLHRV